MFSGAAQAVRRFSLLLLEEGEVSSLEAFATAGQSSAHPLLHSRHG